MVAGDCLEGCVSLASFQHAEETGPVLMGKHQGAH